MKCNGRTCNNEALPGAKACQRCRDWRRKWKKKYREERPASSTKKRSGKKCSRSDCQNVADEGYRRCKRCRDQQKEYEDSVRPQLRERHNKHYQQVKGETFAHYGGPKCECCGEEHIEFLSIDHIEGDGASHRATANGSARNGKNLYYWLKKNGFPPGFRVLCMNCNFSLGHHGYCPHGDLKQVCRAGRPRTVPTPVAVG